MANTQSMTYSEIFTAYYSQFRADYDVPGETDDEYLVGMRLANEAINYWANYDATYWNELFDTNRTDGSGDQTIVLGQSIYNAPINFKEAGGAIRVLNPTGATQQIYPIIEPHEAQFRTDNSTYAYFTSSPIYYNAGTASQTGTTVTGVGTTWTATMVGMQFQFDTGESATITAFTNATTLEVSVTQTVASSTYQIIYRGYKLHLNPAPQDALAGMFIEYDYYKAPTLFTTGLSTTEMRNPYFIVHRMLANQFRAARNPYYSSALRDSENAIKLMQLDNNSGSWANPPTITDNSDTAWGI